MLNTKKFLYIFPDSTCIAEVLPTKKEHVFAIQSFRQINGEFLDENEFLAENMEKLMAKIDPEEYVLVLPDFLFTNTILNLEDTTEASAKKHVYDQVLPKLDMSDKTHQLFVEVLTHHSGKTKVQLSAIERQVLQPVQEAAASHDITFTSVVPLSWSIKSLVSLEPSITIIQMGSSLYTALQYIGVDQTVSFPVTQIDSIVESMKTLKGSEPSIQTVYLLTNDLVESSLKEKLSNTLPLQQLSLSRDKEAQIPPYVSQTIEACAKTLDITDYSLPKFTLESLSTGKKATTVASDMPQPEISASATQDIDAQVSSPKQAEEEDEVIVEPVIVPAAVVAGDVATKAEIASPVVSIVDGDDDQDVANLVVAAPTDEDEKPADDDNKDGAPLSMVITDPPPKSETEEVQSSSEGKKTTDSDPEGKDTISFVEPPLDSVSQAVEVQKGDAMSSFDNETFSANVAAKADETPKAPERVIIKNKSGMGGLLKVIGITLGALVLTVGIGVGLGMALLSFSEKGNKSIVTPIVEATPVPIVQESPATEASPLASTSLSSSASPSAKPSGSPKASPKSSASPTPSASPNALRSNSKVLIVNATKTSGVAGKLKDLLTAAGYKSVATANAKGTYATAGTFALTTKTNLPLVSDLEKAGSLSFDTSSADKATEDPEVKYDVVIVINE